MLSMFLVVFYCALIPFIVSASSGNDTSRNGSERPSIASVSTVVTKLTKTMKPPNAYGKHCAPQINDSEITQILELTKRDIVNIIDLHLISGSAYNNKMFADMQVSLVNPVGREILYILDDERYNYNTWTLNAGRKSFSLHAKESPTGCQGDIYDLVAVNALKQIALKTEKPTDYEICYLELYTFWKQRRMCCRASNHDIMNFKYECLKIDSFLHNSSFFWILTTVMIGLFPIYFVWLLHVLFSYTVFDKSYSQYHKLRENTMSISSILLKIIWKEQGRVISHIRRSVLICAVSCMGYFCLKYSPLHFIVYICSFVIYSICCIGVIVKRRNACYLLTRLPIPEDEECVGVVTALTLPFNVKFLRHHKTLRQIKDTILRTPNVSITNCTRQCFVKYTCYLLKIILCLFVFLVLVIPGCFIGPYLYVLFYEMANIMMIIIILDRERNPDKYSYPSFFHWLDRFITIAFLTFFFQSCYVLVFAIQAFLLGLFLNLVYFIPHLAIFSVLTFYSYSYWKSLEEKYLLLKLLIYEACRDNPVNNNIRNLEENEKLLSVVSKQLHEKIREKFLPYHTNLFWITLKLLWSSVFCYAIYELVNMLHKFNITAAVQVVATASVSILPLLFKIVAWNISNEQTEDAWKEELKLNVKHSVNQFTANDPNLAKTFLIIQGEGRNNGIRSGNGNVHASHSEENSSNPVPEVIAVNPRDSYNNENIQYETAF